MHLGDGNAKHLWTGLVRVQEKMLKSCCAAVGPLPKLPVMGTALESLQMQLNLCSLFRTKRCEAE